MRTHWTLKSEFLNEPLRSPKSAVNAGSVSHRLFWFVGRTLLVTVVLMAIGSLQLGAVGGLDLLGVTPSISFLVVNAALITMLVLSLYCWRSPTVSVRDSITINFVVCHPTRGQLDPIGKMLIIQRGVTTAKRDQFNAFANPNEKENEHAATHSTST